MSFVHFSAVACLANINHYILLAGLCDGLVPYNYPEPKISHICVCLPNIVVLSLLFIFIFPFWIQNTTSLWQSSVNLF